MGPALFALAIHRALLSARSSLREGISEDTLLGEVLGYLDDIGIVGPLDRLAGVFAGLQTALSALGLMVQARKCCLYSPEGVSPALVAGGPLALSGQG